MSGVIDRFEYVPNGGIGTILAYYPEERGGNVAEALTLKGSDYKLRVFYPVDGKWEFETREKGAQGPIAYSMTFRNDDDDKSDKYRLFNKKIFDFTSNQSFSLIDMTVNKIKISSDITCVYGDKLKNISNVVIKLQDNSGMEEEFLIKNDRFFIQYNMPGKGKSSQKNHWLLKLTLFERFFPKFRSLTKETKFYEEHQSFLNENFKANIQSMSIFGNGVFEKFIITKDDQKSSMSSIKDKFLSFKEEILAQNFGKAQKLDFDNLCNFYQCRLEETETQNFSPSKVVFPEQWKKFSKIVFN